MAPRLMFSVLTIMVAPWLLRTFCCASFVLLPPSIGDASPDPPPTPPFPSPSPVHQMHRKVLQTRLGPKSNSAVDLHPFAPVPSPYQTRGQVLQTRLTKQLLPFSIFLPPSHSVPRSPYPCHQQVLRHTFPPVPPRNNYSIIDFDHPTLPVSNASPGGANPTGRAGAGRLRQPFREPRN